MRTLVIGLALSINAAGCTGDSEPTESPAQACEKYRDHLLDVRLDGISVDRESHRGALQASLGTDFVDRCVAELTQADLDCAMAAKTTDQLRSCRARR